MVYTGMLWDDRGLVWDVLGCSRLFRHVLGYTGMFWDFLGCTGMYWDALGYSGIFWDVLGCTGVSVTSVQSNGSTKCRANLDKTSVSD